MVQIRIKDLVDEDLQTVREDITSGVHGLPIVPMLNSGVKVTLTRVKPGGEFPLHKDEYHHVLYFISGRGVGWLENEEYQIKPRRAVHISAGTFHGYRNDSAEPMMLLTINIPVTEL